MNWTFNTYVYINCLLLLSVMMEENETAKGSDISRQNEDSISSEEPTYYLEDEFDTTDEEKDEDETMLDDLPMPVFDMKSYVTHPFEEITDDFTDDLS